MFKFIKKSPLGFLLGAAAIVFVVSPEAREGARKAIVKGTAAVLNFADQVKTTALPSQTSSELLTTPAEQVADEETPLS